MAAPKNPNREAAARGGAKSSRKGVPNKVTLDVVARLRELGCDPLDLSAKIALGEELDGPHPSLAAFRAFADDLTNLEDKGGAVTIDLIERLRALIDDNLTKGYVPIELRSKHITDLMRYTYPQRRAVEVKAELHDKRPPRVDPTKLSDDALKQLVGARVGEIVEAEIIEDDDEDE